MCCFWGQCDVFFLVCRFLFLCVSTLVCPGFSWERSKVRATSVINITPIRPLTAVAGLGVSVGGFGAN